MLKVLYVNRHDIWSLPNTAYGMYKCRKRQFKDRLGWDVTVTPCGFEMDQYDNECDPLYTIVVDEEFNHLGSMRYLPTTGRTMVNEHFSYLLPDGPIRSAVIWEATRFVIDENACFGNTETTVRLATNISKEVVILLNLAGSEIMEHFEVDQFVGVFAEPMLRVYRAFGNAPQKVLDMRDGIGVGLWNKDEDRVEKAKSKLSPDSEYKFNEIQFDTYGIKFK